MDHSEVAHPHKASEPHLVQGEDEHPHEKKTVMQKVKARARKIRNSMRKHVSGDHSHDHDGDQVRDVHDIDEDDDEDDDDDDDEEVVEDPEIHGAPIYESATVKSTTTPENTPFTSLSDHGVSKTNETGHNKTSVPETELNTPIFDHGPSRTSETGHGKISVPGTQVHTPLSSSSHDHGASRTSETDHGKTFVPGTESGSVHLESPDVKAHLSDFSHEHIKRSSYVPGDIKESDPTKTFVPGTESDIDLERSKELERDPQDPEDSSYKHTSSNYQTKVTDPTGTGAKEIETTPLLGSFDKMNIHDDSEPKPKQDLANVGLSTGSHDQFCEETSSLAISTPQHPKTNPYDETSQKSSTPTSYTDNALNVVASELGHDEKNDTGSHETTGDYGTTNYPVDTPQHPKTVEEHPKTVEEHLGTLKPERNPDEITSQKPSTPTSYSEKISNATSAIYGAVASTFGYGEANEKVVHEPTREPASETETGYRKELASTETDKLTPLDEKDAMPKMHGSRELEKTSSGTEGEDRGVSVKDHLAEKLIPGDEDRALSEVISDAFNKRNEEPEEEGSESHPMGKVTVSDHVAKTLGTADEQHESNTAIKARGKVASWFGLGGDQSQDSQDSSTDTPR